MQDVIVSYAELHKLCATKLLDAGVPAEHARIVTDVLVHANLRGVDSHGVMRMEHYIRKLAHGGINAAPSITVKDTGAVTAVVDGDDGLGHVVVHRAMNHAIELAQKEGVGMVGAVNSSHCGALSYFVNMAAERNMIGIAMTNTDKMVVPFGGSKSFFGTNPMAYGFPSSDGNPIILDMATSAVAYGKVLESQMKNQPIPPDWGVDDKGQAVTDPEQVSGLLPFGGAKGYGLGMVVDIFAGLLTGSPYGPHIGRMHGGDYSERRKLGHFICAIDVARFTDRDGFLNGMAQMAGELHAVSPAPGFKQVMVPGEPESLKEKSRIREGIPIARECYDFLNS